MGKDRELTLRPIGRVAKGRPWPDDGEPLEERAAEIEIDAAWVDALDGIEGFSHVWVVWWVDRSGGPPDVMQVRPEGRPGMPLVGLFATRSPRRPNPVGITAVRLLERKGTQLRVQGLDAFEGTPVLDIKPYLRRGDLIPDATGPEWLQQLWQTHDEEHREA
jgi:tRNA-Thr(GGU) m(6)t(6)A37 methyltransferase TsaA